jgi:hypothetical protein
MQKRFKSSIGSEFEDDYVVLRFKEKIDWYWKNAKYNKFWYKFLRGFIIIVGTLVTLVTTLLAAGNDEYVIFIPRNYLIFSAPILAALLTLLNTFSQNYRYGAAWKDMILNAEKLEKELDKYLLDSDRNSRKNNYLEQLHKYVIEETESFFERVLSGRIIKSENFNNK